MTKEIAEILGAMAAVFVGVILVDMWLGGGMLGQFSPYGYSPIGSNAGPSVPASQASSSGGPNMVAPVQIN